MNKNKLKDVRESKGITRVWLAEKSGVNIWTIQAIEAHRVNTDVVKAIELAKALKVTVNKIFDYREFL